MNIQQRATRLTSSPTFNSLKGSFSFDRLYQQILGFYETYIIQSSGIILFIVFVYASFNVALSGLAERPESNLHKAKSAVANAILGIIILLSVPALVVVVSSLF